MLYEKPDESFSQKIELDDLDHLPGEQALDKTRAWEKLHSRLQKKPGGNIIRWYCTAAACLLLIVGIPWLTMNERDHKSVKSGIKQLPANPLILQTPSTDKDISNLSQAQTGRERPNSDKEKSNNNFSLLIKTLKSIHPFYIKPNCQLV